MAKVIIFLEKYSDWLEASSVLKYYCELTDIKIYFIDNDRNDLESIAGIFNSLLINTRIDKFEYISCNNRTELFDYANGIRNKLTKGDILVAPFIRYKNLWGIISKVPNNITTIHLSECLPDTFGVWKYRLGYRYNVTRGIKILTIPIFALFAYINKPDICFFPFKNKIRNTFVKKTIPPFLPELKESKKFFFQNSLSGEQRVLLIGGFGFSIEKMASYFKLDKYIATSKNKEIIIDGTIYPLTERICAEEVLLSGIVTKIIGYNSTVMIWAKMYFPNVEVLCFASSQLNRQYGKYYEKYSREALNKIGVELLPENIDLLEE